MAYQRIEDYGLIGNMHTAALVGLNGSVDWLCLPHFDSPSIFAAILDDKKGGYWSIAPESNETAVKQVYWPETNVLITRFLHKDGIVAVIDYMPPGLEEGDYGFRHVIRRIEVIRGTLKMRMRCCPAFNYARDSHTIYRSPRGVVFESKSISVELVGQAEIQINEDLNCAEAVFEVSQGKRTWFALRMKDDQHKGPPMDSHEIEQMLFEQTITYWHNWLSKCKYAGRWREQVYRSALALKLMTFEPTGAIVASPTCSLPEAIPGSRNWDYRFIWIRDASFSLYALLRLGFTEEAEKFMGWLEQRCHERKADGGLQTMYGLRGEQQLPELTLDHLDGYKGCKPVRIGNAAAEQLQLDIYGELMDSVYLYNKHGAPISWSLWTELSALVEWVCDHWMKKDEGIWETRAGRQHFVYSKLMCWVAIDRALRLADKRSLPANRLRWLKVRDEIYLDVMKHGWNEKIKSFVQHYDSDQLDASTLIMPMVFFMAPNDPRMLQTLDAICKDPADGGLLTANLVYRYQQEGLKDGLTGNEGTFNMCTFWLVEALTRAGQIDRGKLDKARLMFERMLGYSNHLGLYAEQTSIRGEALGNYPQAFTHLALISCAFNLDRTLGDKNW